MFFSIFTEYSDSVTLYPGSIAAMREGLAQTGESSEDGIFYEIYPSHYDRKAIAAKRLVDRLVFLDKESAIKCLAYFPLARMKAFNNITDARRFVCVHDDIPLDESQPTKYLTDFIDPMIIDIVMFQRIVFANECDVVKSMISINPKILVTGNGQPTKPMRYCDYNIIHFCAQHNRAEIAEFILSTISSRHFASLFFKNEMMSVEKTIAHSKNILNGFLNMKDLIKGDTPLHVAAKYGNVEMVEVLTSFSMCKLRTNLMGLLPLDTICENVYARQVNFMIIHQMLMERYYTITELPKRTPKKSKEKCTTPPGTLETCLMRRIEKNRCARRSLFISTPDKKCIEDNKALADADDESVSVKWPLLLSTSPEDSDDFPSPVTSPDVIKETKVLKKLSLSERESAKRRSPGHSSIDDNKALTGSNAEIKQIYESASVKLPLLLSTSSEESDDLPSPVTSPDVIKESKVLKKLSLSEREYVKYRSPGHSSIDDNKALTGSNAEIKQIYESPSVKLPLLLSTSSEESDDLPSPLTSPDEIKKTTVPKWLSPSEQECVNTSGSFAEFSTKVLKSDEIFCMSSLISSLNKITESDLGVENKMKAQRKNVKCAENKVDVLKEVCPKPTSKKRKDMESDNQFTFNIPEKKFKGLFCDYRERPDYGEVNAYPIASEIDGTANKTMSIKSQATRIDVNMFTNYREKPQSDDENTLLEDENSSLSD